MHKVRFKQNNAAPWVFNMCTGQNGFILPHCLVSRTYIHVSVVDE